MMVRLSVKTTDGLFVFVGFWGLQMKMSQRFMVASFAVTLITSQFGCGGNAPKVATPEPAVQQQNVDMMKGYESKTKAK